MFRFCFIAQLAVLDDTEETLKQIGKGLRELRYKAGYKGYHNFSLDFSLNGKHYWSAENGSNISLAYLIRVLKIHDMKLKDFFIYIESL